AQNSSRSRPERYDAAGSGAETGGPLPSSLHRDRIDPDLRAGRLLALAAGRPGEDKRKSPDCRGSPHATHCQRAHWTTATPSRSELTATTPVWTRGRPPRDARARKSGKIVRPNRGIESSGQRSLGTLSG